MKYPIYLKNYFNELPMNRVLGMGNALVDVLARLTDDRILEEFSLPKGSMQLVDKELSNRLMAVTLGLQKHQSSGGSASNTIHGLANLGIETGFVGKTGMDNLGRFFEQDMRKIGINPFLFHSLEETGRSIALISPDTERTMATFLGAAIDLYPADITSDIFEGYDYFYVEGYLVQNRKLIQKALRIAKSQNLVICLDLASYNVVSENLNFLRKITREYADIVFANEMEAEAFTGKGPEDALVQMSDFCDISVIKMGKKGSIMRKGNEQFTIGIHKVDSIDSTGAGDLYASGFIYGLCKNLSLEKCGYLGSILGAYVTEVIGAKLDPDQWLKVKEKVKEIEQS